MNRKWFLIIPILILFLSLTVIFLWWKLNKTNKQQQPQLSNNRNTVVESSIVRNDNNVGNGRLITYEITGKIVKEPYQKDNSYFIEVEAQTSDGNKTFIIKLGENGDNLPVNQAVNGVEASVTKPIPLNEAVSLIKLNVQVKVSFLTEIFGENVIPPSMCDAQCQRIVKESQQYGRETEDFLSNPQNIKESKEIKITTNQIIISI